MRKYATRPLPDETHTQRFWSHVDRSGGPDACWPWLLCKDAHGYGHFSLWRKPVGAHRVAFAIAHGHYPEHGALHHCDNPSCVNPKHLYDGTQKDNIADMKARGRLNPARGIRNYNAKLTDQDIRDIREAISLGYTQDVIAERYGIKQYHVSKIASAKLWAHVKD